MKYVGPIFHEEKYAAWLLRIGSRRVSIYQNSFGDYYAGTKFLLSENKQGAVDVRIPRRGKPLYRIVVRLKKGVTS